MRHSLSEESTRAATVLGSWVASFPDLVPRSDIVNAFKDKGKRLGSGKGKSQESSATLPVANIDDVADMNTDK
jgi:hypothetical protein